VIVIPVVLLLALLLLAANLFWQDTVGSWHPVVLLAEVLGLFLVFHVLKRLSDRWLKRP
jgi:hypothetical protein